VRKVEEGYNNFKIENEDINEKKVAEIHSALKLLNRNIGKVGADAKDRFDIVSNNVKQVENAGNAQIQDLRNKAEVDDRTLEDRVTMAAQKVNDQLKK
jgi:hypothetical protein